MAKCKPNQSYHTANNFQ